MDPFGPPARLRVLFEYECSCIWLVLDGEVQGIVEHEELGLPQPLIDRFVEWNAAASNSLNDPVVAAAWPRARFDAFGRQLAQDLKAFLGPDYLVEYCPETGEGPSEPLIIDGP